MTNLKNLARYAKLHVALVGVALTWYVATYPNGQYVKYVAAAIGLGTALGVWRVKNAPKVKAAPKHAEREHTVRHVVIPEIVVPGKPLGRHVHHDSRSLDYQVVPDGTVATVRWDRLIPVLDQGNVGSCTGNAATGALGTTPNAAGLPSSVPTTKLTETFALALYSAAETIDGDGPYPPQDNGSSGLSVAKAAKNAGLISAYLHITSIAGAQTAIQTGPFIVGSNWMTGMDNPNADGLVNDTGTVRGGHEYECIGYNAETDLWEFVNSWAATWGVGGHFFYSTATFKELLAADGDATQFVPNPSTAPTPSPSPSADASFAPAVNELLGTKGCPKYFETAAKAWKSETGL